jgi:uncharacterized protein
MYALVTGASKGIGKAIAAELAQRKYPLLLIARSEDLLGQIAADFVQRFGVQVHTLAIDLAAPNAPQRVLDWCTEQGYAVSILVNNAGYGLSGPFDGNTVASNTDMLQLNATALVQLCQLFLPMLKAQPKGYILNIASSTAYQPIPLMSLYAATKVLVLYFSRGLRHELRKTNVSVTVVSPGATATDFNDRANIGAAARKAGEKVSMTPEAVARIAVQGMFAGRIEVIPGFINQLGKFFAWLLPNRIVESAAAGIYEDK